MHSATDFSSKVSVFLASNHTCHFFARLHRGRHMADWCTRALRLLRYSARRTWPTHGSRKPVFLRPFFGSSRSAFIPIMATGSRA